MSNDLRSKIIRLAHEKPELREKLLPLLKEGNVEKQAGRNGEATLRLGGKTMTVYWKTTYSPHGLAAENMPKTAMMVEQNLQKFVRHVARAWRGDPKHLEVANRHPLTLLDVDKSKGSIIFKLQATVKVTGRKPFTEEALAAIKPELESRFGYTITVW